MRFGYRADRTSVLATGMAGACATIVHDTVMTPFDGRRSAVCECEAPDSSLSPSLSHTHPRAPRQFSSSACSWEVQRQQRAVRVALR